MPCTNCGQNTSQKLICAVNSLRQKKHSGFPVTSLIVEMDGKKMNYGARLRLAQGLRLDTGWLGQEQRVYLGLTYTN